MLSLVSFYTSAPLICPQAHVSILVQICIFESTQTRCTFFRSVPQSYVNIHEDPQFQHTYLLQIHSASWTFI